MHGQDRSEQSDAHKTGILVALVGQMHGQDRSEQSDAHKNPTQLSEVCLVLR